MITERKYYHHKEYAHFVNAKAPLVMTQSLINVSQTHDHMIFSLVHIYLAERASRQDTAMNRCCHQSAAAASHLTDFANSFAKTWLKGHFELVITGVDDKRSESTDSGWILWKIVGVCIFASSPVIAVTMGHSVKSGVEDAIIRSLAWDDVKAVVVLTAAFVCAHKDS